MAWIPLAMTAASVLPSLFGGKSSSWSGTKASYKKVPALNDYQQHVLKNLLKHINVGGSEASQQPLYQSGTNFLQGLLSQDPEMMRQFEAPAMRQFQEEIVPGIAERFSGVGAQSSSAFRQAMGQAGAGLAERLAALRGGLGLQAAGQALPYSQLPFQQEFARAGLGLGTSPFGYQQIAGTPGMGSMLSQNLGQAGASAMGLQAVLSAFGGGGSSGTTRRIFPSYNALTG